MPRDGFIKDDLGTRVKAFSVTFDTDELEPASIENAYTVSSYSWLPPTNDTPTIAVPGSPRIWNNSPSRVKQDSGTVYVDQNTARTSTPGTNLSPLSPLFAAIDALHGPRGIMSRPGASDVLSGNFDYKSLDLITDRNNLRKLLRWVNGSSDRFRIDVECGENGTVVFTRREDRHTVHANGGLGHQYEKASTRPVRRLEHATGYHHIVSQRMGGIQVLLRFEVDACIDDPTNDITNAFSNMSVKPAPSTSTNREEFLKSLNKTPGTNPFASTFRPRGNTESKPWSKNDETHSWRTGRPLAPGDAPRPPVPSSRPRPPPQSSAKQTYPTDRSRIHVIRIGPPHSISSSSLIEIKTCSTRRGPKWNENYGQIYLSQTPHLYLAMHTEGEFQPAVKYQLTLGDEYGDELGSELQHLSKEDIGEMGDKDRGILEYTRRSGLGAVGRMCALLRDILGEVRREYRVGEERPIEEAGATKDWPNLGGENGIKMEPGAGEREEKPKGLAVVCVDGVLALHRLQGGRGTAKPLGEDIMKRFRGGPSESEGKTAGYKATV